jgi:hypothetical protein
VADRREPAAATPKGRRCREHEGRNDLETASGRLLSFRYDQAEHESSGPAPGCPNGDYALPRRVRLSAHLQVSGTQRAVDQNDDELTTQALSGRAATAEGGTGAGAEPRSRRPSSAITQLVSLTISSGSPI